jgi:NADH:ubiquinone oxidoreductase subunit 6 (subunit J)
VSTEAVQVVAYLAAVCVAVSLVCWVLAGSVAAERAEGWRRASSTTLRIGALVTAISVVMSTYVA